MAKILEIPKSEKIMRSYDHKDSNGVFRLLELRNRGSSQFNRKTRPNLYYPIYINPVDGTVSIIQEKHHTEVALPKNSKDEDGCWTWSKYKVENHYNLIVPKKNQRRYLADFQKRLCAK